jgi:hypothetical protein
VLDRIAQPWGDRTPYGRGDLWPVRVDQHLAEEVGEESVERWVQSASVLHSTSVQLKWLSTRMKQAAPQALVVSK